MSVPVSYGSAKISDGGGRVAFGATVHNPFAGSGQWDVYLYGRTQDVPYCISSIGSAGLPAGYSRLGDLSDNGRWMVFSSGATRLLDTPDTNDAEDVFLTRIERHNWVNTRVSRGPGGRQANGDSSTPVLSADGRYIAYVSTATNLTRRADTNRRSDVFIRNRKTGATRMVSLNSSERQGNGDSLAPAISGNGRYVAFISKASNLVSGDTNGHTDVFVRDLRTLTTRRVSLTASGRQFRQDTEGAVISADGSVVAFQEYSSDREGWWVTHYVRDLKARRTELLSTDEAGSPHRRQDAGVGGVALSANGRFASFSTYAYLTATDSDPPNTDIDNDDVLDSDIDVYLRDRRTDEVVLVSVLPDAATPVQGYSLDMDSHARRILLSSTAPLSGNDTNNNDDLWVRNVTEFTAPTGGVH